MGLARRKGRSCWQIGLFLSCCAAPVQAFTCTLDRVDDEVQASHITDGDTLKLSDGRKLRLIGIDTPELGHRGAASQPFAEAATLALRKLVMANDDLQLRFDAERHDKYQRLLAHAFLPNGDSIEASLLEQGLASVLTVPPNIWNLACYQATEKRARKARRGIWSHPRYQPMATSALRADDTGFHIIKGRVESVGRSKNSLWLNLADDVALRIDREDMRYFDTQTLDAAEHRQILARGWLNPQRNARRGGLVMRIRHPAALEWVN